MKTRSDVSDLAEITLASLATLRNSAPENCGDAITTLEFFVAVALRVMSASKPGKVRDAARTVAIQVMLPKQ